MGGGKGGGGGSDPMVQAQFANALMSIQQDRSEALIQKQQEDYQRTFKEQADRQATDFAKINAEQQQKAELADATNKIQTLFTNKFAAADAATTEVNAQITDEMTHARLSGLDYAVDPAAKQNRINDVFATKWNEADDTTLSGLVSKYGDMGYKWDLPITRGNAEAAIAGITTAGDPAGEKVKKGAKKAVALATSTSPLGGSPILG